LSFEDSMALSSAKEAMIVEGCLGMSAVYTVYNKGGRNL
jgi:hypothetical protein